jgi:CRISPR-associated protein Cas5t
MFALTIKAFAMTASFRIPENHTFQQTLPLPPPTTLTGLMGAALGLNFEKAMKFREENDIRFGVVGVHKGEMRDLWKYNKIKTSYKEDGSDRHDILIREYLTDIALKIAVGAEDEQTLTKIREAFLNPKYALTAGNSDDLLKIYRVSSITKADECQYSDFEVTVLPGNQTGEYESLLDLKNTPITYTVRAPQVYLLPTAFKFNGDERRIIERNHLTFVGSPIRLKNPISTYNIGDGMFALL